MPIDHYDCLHIKRTTYDRRRFNTCLNNVREHNARVQMSHKKVMRKNNNPSTSYTGYVIGPIVVGVIMYFSNNCK